MDRLADIQALLRRSLQLDDDVVLEPDTELLGALPEFDSMAVVVILGEIESTFGIQIPDDEIEGEAFATVGALHDFVLGHLAS